MAIIAPAAPPATAEMAHGAEAAPYPMEDSKNYAVVKVFFGTDRQLTTNDNPSMRYSGERSNPLIINYGSCSVTIPRDHRMGELESPSIWKLEFREDIDKHVVLLGCEYPQ